MSFVVFFLVLLGTFVEGELSLLIILGWMVFHEIPVDLSIVIAAALPGAFFGDWFCFELGSRYGDTFDTRFPRLSQRAKSIGMFLAKYSIVGVLLLRFQIGMRALGNFCLGQGMLQRERFLLLNVVACVLWVMIIPGFCYGFLIIFKVLLGQVT